MKYNLSEIMKRAWELFRKAYLKIARFGEALHRAWEESKKEEAKTKLIEDAIKASGIVERVRTWYGWTQEGREVIHESKCLFQVTVPDPSRGDGKTRVLSFFGMSQTAPIEG